VSASAGTGGTISPASSTVNNGSTTTFTVTPSAGYTATMGGACGGSPASGTAQFTYTTNVITANCTVTATFTANPVNGVCGTSSGGSFTTAPTTNLCSAGTATGVNGSGPWTWSCTGSNGGSTANCSANIQTRTVSASAGTGGTISPASSTVNNGSTTTFTVTPNAGYTATMGGTCGGSLSGTTYTTNAITADCTVSASFTEGDTTNDATTEIPKTGQTMTYALGDDGDIQAGVEWTNPRFTNNGDGTVTDNLTGLMWLKDGGCLKNTWSGALNTIAGLNNHTGGNTCTGYTADHTDWRLPNVKELESLINYGVPNTAMRLNSEGFVNIKSSYYWSSTTPQSSTSGAFSIRMSDGLEIYSSKRSGYYLLPVRNATSENPYELPKTGQTTSYASGDDGNITAGIEWPSPRFTDNNDGTVTDNLTGLMWLKDGGCFKNGWNYTFSSIDDFNGNPGGHNCLGYTKNYSDWRLPNVKELESLINYGASNPATWLNSEGFANVMSNYYWTSTTYPNSSVQAFVINMTKGDKASKRKSYSYYTWPVRGGNIE
jgi:hypothetical protein